MDFWSDGGMSLCVEASPTLRMGYEMFTSRTGQTVSRVFVTTLGVVASVVAVIVISYIAGFEAWVYNKGGFWSAVSPVVFAVMTLVLFRTRGRWQRSRSEDMPLLAWAFSAIWLLISIIH